MATANPASRSGVASCVRSAASSGCADTTYTSALADDARAREAYTLVRDLRERGLSAEMEQAGRSLKGQLKHADRIGARSVIIVGDDLQVKDMDSGDQREAASAEEALELAAGAAR